MLLSLPKSKRLATTFFRSPSFFLQDCIKFPQVCDNCEVPWRIHLPTPSRFFREICGRYIPVIRRRTHFGPNNEMACLTCHQNSVKKRANALETARRAFDRRDRKDQLHEVMLKLGDELKKVTYCQKCRIDDNNAETRAWIIFISLRFLFVKIFCLICLALAIHRWFLL